VILKAEKFSVARCQFALPGGDVVTRSVVRHPGGVVVLPLLDERTLVLIRTYRPAVGSWLLELPAGTLEEGEEPSACALRELREETGYEAERIEPISSIYTAPGYSDEVLWAFAAWCRPTPSRQDLQPDERIEPVALDIGEAVELARSRRIRDGKTLAVLFLWMLKTGRSKP